MKLRLIVAVAVVVVLAAGVGFSQQPQAVKLEGAWVARVTSYNGGPYPFLGQWSYVLQPDPSGRRATLHGSVDLRFPSSPTPGSFNSPLIGECAMTGSATATCFSIWYSIQGGDPVDSLIDIGTAYSEVTPVGTGTSEVTHHFAIYSPDADEDGDGFPDPGQSPLRTFVVTTRDVRLPHPVVR